MPSFKSGDRVRIVDRPLTTADAKSGLYYDYFRNLIGTVDRVYDDSVCVRVDLDSLPEDISRRHEDVQNSVKKRWIEGLGPEQLGRLSEADKKVTLSYNILVGPGDLESAGKAKPAPKPKAEALAPAPQKAAKPTQEVQAARRSQEEIDKAEEEYLKSLAKETNG